MEYSKSTDTNVHEYTVTELNQAIQGTLEINFESIKVKGEISGLNKAGSGHAYLSLKDQDSIIKVVIWRSTLNKINFQPEDGMEVVVKGDLKTWAPASIYQVVVKSIEIAGEGSLLRLIEERKKKLSEEGLFSSIHKKDLPYIPKCIGIITSETGAAFKDIIKILRDRFPIPVLLFPVLVQGKGAPIQIANAINKINEIYNSDLFKEKNINYPDLLIVGRGGGSIEDLMPFNEEVVVRAIYRSKIPIISAVGHEIDNTLSDLVADLRAPTPTAAAELAVPEKIILLNDIQSLENRLLISINRCTKILKEKLKAFSPSAPYMLFENKTLMLNENFNEIKHYIINLFSNLQTNLQKQKLLSSSIINSLDKDKVKLDSIGKLINTNLISIRNTNQQVLKNISKTLNEKVVYFFELNKVSFTGISGKLESVSYENILSRGFAMIEDDKNELIKSIKDLTINSNVVIKFKDGKAKAKIRDKS